MSTPRQKPIDFAAEGLCLASLSIPTAESGFNGEAGIRHSVCRRLNRSQRQRAKTRFFSLSVWCDGHTESGRWLLCGEHAKSYLGFVGTKNERPYWRENNIGGRFQHRIDGVAGWSFVVVDGHNIISRREIWNRKLEYLVFDPDKFFSRNFFSVGIGSQEFKFRPVHHRSTDLNSRPAH